MKQVLLADKSDELSPRPPRHRTPPFVMWMSDDILPGDTFVWKGHVYMVSQVYGTGFSHGPECQHTEYPRQRRTYGVVLDPKESTGVPGAGGAGAN